MLFSTIACNAGTTWALVSNLTTTSGITQPWSAVYDNAGILYVAGNNQSTGGIARSVDKGNTWEAITPPVTNGSKSFRLVCKSQDGTIITIQQMGNPIQAFWLDNVTGTGTTWTNVTTFPTITTGGELGCAVAPNGNLVIPVGSGQVVISSDNGRSYTLAPSPPPSTEIAEALNIITIGKVMYMGAAIKSNTNNPCCDANGGMYWYSVDNGHHWLSLKFPSQMNDCTPTGKHADGTPASGTCSLDAGMTVFVGVGNQAGNFCGYFGSSGNKTGVYCYQGTPGSGQWVPDNTGAWAANCNAQGTNCGQSAPMWPAVANRTGDMIIAAYYQDGGFPLIELDAATNTWSRADAGMTPCTANCGTSGGERVTWGVTNPQDGTIGWFIKDGRFFKTTTSQDGSTTPPAAPTGLTAVPD